MVVVLRLLTVNFNCYDGLPDWTLSVFVQSFDLGQLLEMIFVHKAHCQLVHLLDLVVLVEIHPPPQLEIE